MITVKCSSPNTTHLNQLVPFQGELKKRTDGDIQELAESISVDGLLMPFAVWQHEDKNYLLDGHGRMAALIHLALRDPDILSQDLPCIIIQAETEEEARKSLLQITSSYGRINPKGVLEFSAQVIDYKAPVLQKVVRKVQKREKKESDYIVLKVRVKKEELDAVKEIFKKSPMVELV